MGATFSVYSGGYYSHLIANIPNLSTHGITSVNHGIYLDQAVREYSRFRPRKLVHGQRGSGASDGIYSLPSAYAPEFSRVTAIESPIDEIPPSFLSEDQWHVFEEGGNTLGFGSRIQLVSVQPSDGEYFRISFLAPHSVNSTNTTIEDVDSIPVSLLHAAYVAERIERALADTETGTIASDSTDHREQKRMYAESAKQLRSRAYKMLGVETNDKTGQIELSAEGVNVNWDVKFQHRERYLFHARR